MTSKLDVGGVFEIAQMLGVSRQRAFQLTEKPWFPEPVQLKCARIWDLGEVREVFRARGRDL